MLPSESAFPINFETKLHRRGVSFGKQFTARASACTSESFTRHLHRLIVETVYIESVAMHTLMLLVDETMPQAFGNGIYRSIVVISYVVVSTSSPLSCVAVTLFYLGAYSCAVVSELLPYLFIPSSAAVVSVVRAHGSEHPLDTLSSFSARLS